MTPRPQVLVIYKKSAYQLYVLEHRSRHFERLLADGSADLTRMRASHEVHLATLRVVTQTLDQAGVDWRLRYRADVATTLTDDLVVTVGGDGTFLEASHAIQATPILGVNSDPERSDAVFCAATAETFPAKVAEAFAGALSSTWLYRLAITHNGHALPWLALNDVLLCHESPAATSRYRLAIDAHEEEHKSSGIWMAAPAGSTAAISAAGGTRLPWTARQWQYRPRELFAGKFGYYALTGGLLGPEQSLRVTSLMRRAQLFVDGAHLHVPVAYGDIVEIRLALEAPLQVLGLHAANTAAHVSDAVVPESSLVATIGGA